MSYEENLQQSANADKAVKKKVLRRERTVTRRKPIVTYKEVEDEESETSSISEKTSRNDEDFLNKSLNVLDEIEGIYKAVIIAINETVNGKLSFTFQLRVYDSLYSIKAYYKPVLIRRSSLYRLANALELLEDNDINLSMFLNKEVWVSVKTNTVDGKVYENIVDYANMEYEYNELSVNDKGYFIFDD